MKRKHAVHRAICVLAMIAACTCQPVTALARQSVSLKATLTPEHLGHDTTVGFVFRISGPADQIPAPLTGVQLSYPQGIGFALSELGLATCSPQALEIFGPPGCPANSLMGHGTALTKVQFGPLIYEETTNVEIMRTTDANGHLALLICASGRFPIYAQIVFTGTILPAPAPFGGRLDMNIPLVPSLPGAPDVAVAQLRATLGPAGLTYHERIHGQIVNYQPRGVPLPTYCPRGGFRFSTRLSFANGTEASANTIVPCPRDAHARA